MCLAEASARIIIVRTPDAVGIACIEGSSDELRSPEWENGSVMQFALRAASVDDARALAELFAAVAEERDWIATEPPVGIGTRAAQFAGTIAAGWRPTRSGRLGIMGDRATFVRLSAR